MELLVVIGIPLILVVILVANGVLTNEGINNEIVPIFKFLMEKDYGFLLEVRYGAGIDVNVLFGKRLMNMALTFAMLLLILALLGQLTLIYAGAALVLAYLSFKDPYRKLKSYYKRNLSNINQMLPYYLKSLEILVQHYTVPVALAKSVNSAPFVFQEGLKRLIKRIDEGDFSVDPYMEFAKTYPVRDSMRMMRLLYRLSLGSQESKQEQLALFSRNVSVLQNKAREQKYQERLNTMENKTMIMLTCTGGGVLALLMFAMFSMMQI